MLTCEWVGPWLVSVDTHPVNGMITLKADYVGQLGADTLKRCYGGCSREEAISEFVAELETLGTPAD